MAAMPTYDVHLTHMVSTTVTVEADDPEQATERVFESPKMPGSITYGAFGAATVDDAGEWDAVAVYDQAGREVWTAASHV
jgi:hypothetical protein